MDDGEWRSRITSYLLDAGVPHIRGFRRLVPEGGGAYEGAHVLVQVHGWADALSVLREVGTALRRVCTGVVWGTVTVQLDERRGDVIIGRTGEQPLSPTWVISGD